MEKLGALELAEWSAVGFSALFAGGAFFINAVDIPAIKTVKDTKSVQQFFKELYKGGKSVQGKFAISATASGIAAWYKCQSDYRWIYLVGTGFIASVMPWTALVMMKNINTLMEDRVIEDEGEEAVRDRVSLWNKHHMFRTVVSMIALDTFILGIFLTR